MRASGYNHENNQQDKLYRLIYYSNLALHVSGDVFAHHQEHFTVFTIRMYEVFPEFKLVVHESVQRDTTMKITNKIHYID